MPLPLQIAFHGIAPSPAVEARVRERVDALIAHAPDITSCRTLIDAPHRRHHKGRIYRVHVELHLSGAELCVDGNGDRDHAHEDLYVAVRDAFDAMERRLHAFLARRREGRHGEPRVA